MLNPEKIERFKAVWPTAPSATAAGLEAGWTKTEAANFSRPIAAALGLPKKSTTGIMRPGTREAIDALKLVPDRFNVPVSRLATRLASHFATEKKRQEKEAAA